MGRVDSWIERVPPLFMAADLTRLEARQHGAQIRDWVGTGSRNLLLAGPVGTGKSYAAWAIAHDMVARGNLVVFKTVPRLLLDMRPDNDPDAFQRACEADVLVLDDLAAARPTEWATEQMYSIAEERASFMRRTIVTTNASFEQLQALWGSPTMDRLRDSSLDLVLNGASRRGAA
jgi:DNA replication protein DnaC